MSTNLESFNYHNRDPTVPDETIGDTQTKTARLLTASKRLLKNLFKREQIV